MTLELITNYCGHQLSASCCGVSTCRRPTVPRGIGGRVSPSNWRGSGDNWEVNPDEEVTPSGPCSRRDPRAQLQKNKKARLRQQWRGVGWPHLHAAAGVEAATAGCTCRQTGATAAGHCYIAAATPHSHRRAHTAMALHTHTHTHTHTLRMTSTPVPLRRTRAHDAVLGSAASTPQCARLAAHAAALPLAGTHARGRPCQPSQRSRLLSFAGRRVDKAVGDVVDVGKAEAVERGCVRGEVLRVGVPAAKGMLGGCYNMRSSGRRYPIPDCSGRKDTPGEKIKHRTKHQMIMKRFAHQILHGPQRFPPTSEMSPLLQAFPLTRSFLPAVVRVHHGVHERLEEQAEIPRPQ